jgi:hypothetical protein
MENNLALANQALDFAMTIAAHGNSSIAGQFNDGAYSYARKTAIKLIEVTFDSMTAMEAEKLYEDCIMSGESIMAAAAFDGYLTIEDAAELAREYTITSS